MTRITHRITHSRFFDDCHLSSRHEPCHRSRVWPRCPDCTACWCVLLSFSPPFSLPEVLMDHHEGMRGSDSAFPIRKGQPVVPQAEKLDETSPSASCCIPSRVFRHFSSMRGGSKIDNSQRNLNDNTGDQPTQAGQLVSQAGEHIRAYFLTTAEASLAWPIQNQSWPISII